MTTYAEQLINAYQHQFVTRRGAKTMFTGAGRLVVRTAAERVMTLPDGTKVRVAVDDSGTTTQIEENDSQHAIVRPKSIRVQRLGGPAS